MRRKLTLADKKKICELRDEEQLSYADLSDRYGVSVSHITKILTEAKQAKEEKGHG